MEAEKAQQWRVLCEQAAVEKDPEKLMRLVVDINRLLEEKEQRLSNQHANGQSNRAITPSAPVHQAR